MDIHSTIPRGSKETDKGNLDPHLRSKPEPQQYHQTSPAISTKMKFFSVVAFSALVALVPAQDASSILNKLPDCAVWQRPLCQPRQLPARIKQWANLPIDRKPASKTAFQRTAVQTPAVSANPTPSSKVQPAASSRHAMPKMHHVSFPT